MYNFEHWASKLVQDAIFNRVQVLYNNNNNSLF